MSNIIRAQLFQLLRTRWHYLFFTGLLALELISVNSDSYYREEQLNSSLYLVENASLVCVYALLFLIYIVSVIFCDDIKNKTMYYEIAHGHTRRQIFAARVILAMGGGTAGATILMIAPILYAALIEGGGWGNLLVLRDVLLRGFLVILTFCRIVCELIFISTMLKKSIIVMLVGILYTFSFTFYFGLIQDGIPQLFGMGMVLKLTNFVAWTTFQLTDEKTITVYDATMKSGDIITAIVLFFLMGTTLLLLGYRFLQKDDLN